MGLYIALTARPIFRVCLAITKWRLLDCSFNIESDWSNALICLYLNRRFDARGKYFGLSLDFMSRCGDAVARWLTLMGLAVCVI